jgi:hypothetical protein
MVWPPLICETSLLSEVALTGVVRGDTLYRRERDAVRRIAFRGPACFFIWLRCHAFTTDVAAAKRGRAEQIRSRHETHRLSSSTTSPPAFLRVTDRLEANRILAGL